MTPAVFRFAPSPNGFLHLGHAYSALVNADMARRSGGQLRLRLEDIDPVRSRPDLAAAIVEDLRWLGVAFDGPPSVQSRHLDRFVAAADTLKQRGLLFPCFCSRRDVAEGAARSAAAGRGSPVSRDPDGAPLYPGTCRELSPGEAERRMGAGERPAWRLHSARAAAASPPLAWTGFDEAFATRAVPADPVRWGDAVLVRRDTPTSYHLSVVVDDAAEGVTHVVRGTDLEAATDLHRLLLHLLGLPSPAYHHHRVLFDETGGKLSKSRNARSLADLRREGWSPADIRRAVGFG